jgi:hypothetical protein
MIFALPAFIAGDVVRLWDELACWHLSRVPGRRFMRLCGELSGFGFRVSQTATTRCVIPCQPVTSLRPASRCASAAFGTSSKVLDANNEINSSSTANHYDGPLTASHVNPLVFCCTNTRTTTMGRVLQRLSLWAWNCPHCRHTEGSSSCKRYS